MQVQHVRRALAGLGIILVVTSSAAAAPADEIQSRRDQAVAARERVVELGMKLESAVERFNRANAGLDAVQARIADNLQQLRVTRSNVRKARAALAAQLVIEYRAGDTDAIAALLGARSLDAMLGRVTALRRVNAQTRQVVSDLLTARRELTRRERKLAADRRQADALVASAASAQAEIESGIARQRQFVRGLEDEIAQLEREEAARQRRIAEEARRRLAAQRAADRAAAAPDPGIGGSGAVRAGADGSISVPPPANGSIGARAVAAALRWIGTPYSWGGGNANGPARGIAHGANTVGFDCSGLTLYAYAQVGIQLGHFTGWQWNAGQRIGRMSDLAVGDLVFFGSDLGHMGMYIGNGQMVHAPQTGDVVKISSITSGHYVSSFRGGVRPY